MRLQTYKPKTFLHAILIERTKYSFVKQSDGGMTLTFPSFIYQISLGRLNS